MKTCSECDKPLFDQDYADPDSGLCDACWIKTFEGEEDIDVAMDDGSDDYDSKTRHLV